MGLAEYLTMSFYRAVLTITFTVIVLPPIVYPRWPNIVGVIVKNSIAAYASGIFFAVCPRCVENFIIRVCFGRIVPWQIGTGIYVFGMHFATMGIYMYLTGDNSMAHVALIRLALYPAIIAALGFVMQGKPSQKVATTLGVGPLTAYSVAVVVPYYVITIMINYYL